MATVYKRPGRKFWQAAYLGASGKKIQRSTGKTSKSEAKTIAHQWEAEEKKLKQSGFSEQREFLDILQRAAVDANKGQLTIDRSREYIQQLYEKSNNEELPKYSVAEWLKEWLSTKRGNVGKSTMNRYTQSCEAVVKALGHSAQKDITLLTTQDCQSVQDKLGKSKTAKAKTQNLKMQDFRQALTAAQEQGIISRNVAVPVKDLPEEDSEERYPFETAEVEQLIRESPNSDWRDAILVAAHTGLRMSNITDLSWKEINFDLNALVLEPVKQKKGKKKKHIIIPMSDAVSKRLRQRERDQNLKNPVFPILAGKTSATHSTNFSRIMKKAGVPREIELITGGKAMRSFHSLRHTFISWMTNESIAPEVRKALAGHASSRTHDIYSHIDPSTLKAAVASIPDLKENTN